jgi:molybdate transport system permease protein
VLSGCVLAFARSTGEFGATIMIAGNIPGATRTVPLFVYTQLEAPGGFENAYRLVIISVAISACALLMGELLQRYGQRRLASGDR